METCVCPLTTCQNASSSGSIEEKHLEKRFGEDMSGKEAAPTKLPPSTSAVEICEGGRENATRGAVKVKPLSSERQPRSRTRLSGPLHVQNCKDRLPSLETEQQFRAAVVKCARGGESMERNPPKTGALVVSTLHIPKLPSLRIAEPIISPPAKILPAAMAKEVRHRKTAAEVDAFFARLSAPKYIRGQVFKEKMEIRSGNPLSRAAQRSISDATKGLRVNVVRTRSNSAARSGSRRSSPEK